MAFTYKKHLQGGVEMPAISEFLIANSEGPLTIGDAVQLTTGYLTAAGQTESLIGVVVAFVKDGENIFKSAVSVGGTKASGNTYTAASDNATVDKVKAQVIIDPYALFLNEADSTLTQAEVGLYFDTAAGIDQVTGAGSGTIAQFQLMELVTVNDDGTDEDSKGLFRIAQSQLGWAAS